MDVFSGLALQVQSSIVNILATPKATIGKKATRTRLPGSYMSSITEFVQINISVIVLFDPIQLNRRPIDKITPPPSFSTAEEVTGGALAMLALDPL